MLAFCMSCTLIQVRQREVRAASSCVSASFVLMCNIVSFMRKNVKPGQFVRGSKTVGFRATRRALNVCYTRRGGGVTLRVRLGC